MKRVPLVLMLLLSIPASAQQVPAEDAMQQLINRLIADRDKYLVEAATAVAENSRLKRQLEELKNKLPPEEKKK